MVLSNCVLIRDDGRTVQWRIEHMIQQSAVLADIYIQLDICCSIISKIYSVYSVGAVQRELINLGCCINILVAYGSSFYGSFKFYVMKDYMYYRLGIF